MKIKKYNKFITENRLGHDNESEIITVIKRLQEGKFQIKNIENDTVYFSINLIFRNSVPVSSTVHYNTDFLITNNDFEFTFQQINGGSPRIIDQESGYIIWSLLTEK